MVQTRKRRLAILCSALLFTALVASFWMRADGAAGIASGDAIGQLQQNGWELTGDTRKNQDVFPSEDKISAAYADGGWSVQYKAVTDDPWKDMEHVVQWLAAPYYEAYPDGQDVVYYSSVSNNINYRINNMDGQLYGWFQLQSYAPENGDPWGSLVYTVPQAGEYVITGNEHCPKIGIPCLGFSAADVNFEATYWVELNGEKVANSEKVFNGDNLDMTFPKMALTLEAGDTLRFVVSMGNSWAGWKQQFMMAPVVTRKPDPTTTTTTAAATTTTGGVTTTQEATPTVTTTAEPTTTTAAATTTTTQESTSAVVTTTATAATATAKETAAATTAATTTGGTSPATGGGFALLAGLTASGALGVLVAARRSRRRDP